MDEEKELNQDNLQEIKSSDEDLAAQWASMLENQETNPQEDLAAQWASMLENQQNPESKDLGKTEEKESKESGSIPDDIAKKLELILDIPVTISFEVGSRKLQIEDIVKLSPSSIVELNKNIDQPIDIKVNGVLVAKGELYQVEDKFAVKIVQIISKEERIKLINSQLGGGQGWL